MDREIKTVPFEIKELDEAEGIFTGYAATFSDVPDSYGDIIDKGAFKKTLKERGNRVKVLFNHSWMDPIGKPEELGEDDIGLLVKAKLSLGVQRAREVLSLMKDGVITEMSIGYDTIKQTRTEGIRHLQELKLYDVSPVIFAANPEAVITGVKAGRVLSAASLEKVKKAFDVLQALLAAVEEEEEPAKATQLSEIVADEAAKLEALVGTLKAENDGFDVKQAERRIEAILDQMRK